MFDLGAYFSSSLKEIKENEGFLDNYPQDSIFRHSNLLRSRLTKKQIYNKLCEYDRMLEQIDSQDDPVAVWEEYIDFLSTEARDEKLNDGKSRLFNALEAFTRYSTERDYTKTDPRTAKLWIQYSRCCRDEEDVIYYMEENDIGVNSALFYEAICKITESKLDYQQADKYILEGKLKQVQPESVLQDLSTKFKERMEARIRHLKELASLQMYYEGKREQEKTQSKFKDSKINNNNQRCGQNNIYNQQEDENNEENQQYYTNNARKRKNNEFRMDTTETFWSKNHQMIPPPNKKKTTNRQLYGSHQFSDSNATRGDTNTRNQQTNKQYSFAQTNDFSSQNKNHQGNHNSLHSSYQQHNLHQHTLKLPEKLSLGDGINIYVDEEYRQNVFPISTQLVSEYQLLTEEIQEYLLSISNIPVVSSSTSSNSTHLQTLDSQCQKNKSKLISSLENDLYFPKQNISNDQPIYHYNHRVSQQDQQLQFQQRDLSWIGREEKKYKSFEFCDSQKNSQNIAYSLFDNDGLFEQPLEDVKAVEISPKIQKKQRKYSNNGIIECYSGRASPSPIRLSSQRPSKMNPSVDNTQNKQGDIDKRVLLGYDESCVSGKEQDRDIIWKGQQFCSPLGSQRRISGQIKGNKQQLEWQPLQLEEQEEIEQNPGRQYDESRQQQNQLYSKNQHHLEEQSEDDSDNTSDMEQQQQCLQPNNTTMSDDDYFSDKYSSYLDEGKPLSYCVRARRPSRGFTKNTSGIFAYGDGRTTLSGAHDEGDGMNNQGYLRSKMYKNLTNIVKAASQSSSKHKRQGQQQHCRSIQKIRASSMAQQQIEPPFQFADTQILQGGINSQQPQMILFSQELSQVNNVLSQEGFLSPREFEDNFLVPPKNSFELAISMKHNKNVSKDNNKHVSGLGMEKTASSMTEQEDEEINQMLDKYCFDDDNHNSNNNIHSNSNKNPRSSCHSTGQEEKENLNVIVNQRKSKSQTSIPRKALQQLPIEEFNQDDDILPFELSHSNRRNNNEGDQNHERDTDGGNYCDDECGQDRSNVNGYLGNDKEDIFNGDELYNNNNNENNFNDCGFIFDTEDDDEEQDNQGQIDKDSQKILDESFSEDNCEGQYENNMIAGQGQQGNQEVSKDQQNRGQKYKEEQNEWKGKQQRTKQIIEDTDQNEEKNNNNNNNNNQRVLESVFEINNKLKPSNSWKSKRYR